MKKEIFEFIDNTLCNQKNERSDGGFNLVWYVHKNESELPEKHKERLVIKTEVKFGVKLTKKEYESLKTVGDLTDLVYKNLTARE